MSDNEGTSSRAAEFFSKNGAWYVSAALILGVLLGGIVIVVFSPSNDDEGTDGGGSSAGSDGASAPLTPIPSSADGEDAGTGWSDLGCNEQEGDEEVPRSAPEATWEPVGIMSAPRSDVFGPTVVEGATRECYQHSPTGALVAGANHLVVIATATGPEREAAVMSAVTEGPLRDEALSTEGSSGWALRAFDVESCDPSRCNVVYVVGAGGGLGQLSVSLVWQDGDWRIDGAAENGGGPVDEVPPGYVTWEP